MIGIFDQLEKNKKPENKTILTKEAQLEKYKFAKEVKEFAEAGKLRFRESAGAEERADYFNKKYGNGNEVAKVVSIPPDSLGNAFKVEIATPTREEFKDIVDFEGRLLSEYSKQKMA